MRTNRALYFIEMKIKEVIKRKIHIDATAYVELRVSVYVFAKKCPLNFYYPRRLRRFLLQSCVCAALRIHAFIQDPLAHVNLHLRRRISDKFESCLRDQCLMHAVLLTKQN